MLWLLVHGVHLLLVVVGLVGLAWLLLPQLQSERLQRRTPYRPPATPTEHAARVAALREAVHSGTLTTPDPSAASTYARRRGREPSGGRHDRSTWRPLAVIGSAAAAAVHLVVTPHHLAEAFVVGVFFFVTSIAQAFWAWQVTRQATRRSLHAGIVLSLALMVLWALSRTTGLPWLGREQVGAWDVSSKIWELLVLGACVVGLSRPAEERALPMSFDLGPTVKVAFGLSAVVLMVLPFTASVH